MNRKNWKLSRLGRFFRTLRCAFIGITFLSVLSANADLGFKDIGSIWCIGDSIMQSNADGDEGGSPRKALYELLDENGFRFTFTGHHSLNPDGLPVTREEPFYNLYHYHSGISGSVIGDDFENRTGMTENLSAFWNAGRLDMVKPNIVLIMLGTNDVGKDHNVDEAPQRLVAFLETLYALPEIGQPTLFLASIPPNGRSLKEAVGVDTFNAVVPEIVSRFRSEGKAIYFVDQYTRLRESYETNMRSDNLHPNASGNLTMARQWFNAIVAVFDPQKTGTAR